MKQVFSKKYFYKKNKISITSFFYLIFFLLFWDTFSVSEIYKKKDTTQQRKIWIVKLVLCFPSNALIIWIKEKSWSDISVICNKVFFFSVSFFQLRRTSIEFELLTFIPKGERGLTNSNFPPKTTFYCERKFQTSFSWNGMAWRLKDIWFISWGLSLLFFCWLFFCLEVELLRALFGLAFLVII